MLEALAIAAGLIVSDFLNGSQIFTIAAIKPDFILIFIVYFSLKKGGFAGVWIGFFGGLLIDAEIGVLVDRAAKETTYIGLHSLPFAIIGYVMGQIVRPLYRPTIYSSILTVFSASFFAHISVYLLHSFFKEENVSYGIFWVPFYTSLIAVIYFMMLSVIYKFESQQEYI